MKLKSFAVYDTKVGAYQQPFFTSAAGHAIRSFEAAVNDPETTLCKHPADFTLFEIGEYDDSTGTIENLAAKISLGTALQFKKAPSTQLQLLQETK